MYIVVAYDYKTEGENDIILFTETLELAREAANDLVEDGIQPVWIAEELEELTSDS